MLPFNRQTNMDWHRWHRAQRTAPYSDFAERIFQLDFCLYLFIDVVSPLGRLGTTRLPAMLIECARQRHSHWQIYIYNLLLTRDRTVKRDKWIKCAHQIDHKSVAWASPFLSRCAVAWCGAVGTRRDDKSVEWLPQQTTQAIRKINKFPNKCHEFRQNTKVLIYLPCTPHGANDIFNELLCNGHETYDKSALHSRTLERFSNCSISIWAAGAGTDGAFNLNRHKFGKFHGNSGIALFSSLESRWQRPLTSSSAIKWRT